jgi:branched-chain amino acid transport system ATP-binding protein
MAETLLHADGLVKRFGALAASDGLYLQVADGELHALIGPNGAGKTTLLAQLTGELAPDAGRIRFAGRDITTLPVPARVRLGMARSYQITALFPQLGTLDNVALAIQQRDGHSFRFWRPARRDARLLEPARALLERFGLAGRADIPAGQLAHGEQRRLELAMTLATGPRLLLLDEPLAGMGADDSAAMVELLRELKRHYTILLVEHDMDAVFQLADRITVLVYGRALASGAPEAVRADPEVRAAYLGEPD